mgnify:CR=1 FL=1
MLGHASKMTQHISNLHHPHEFSQVSASELAYQDCVTNSGIAPEIYALNFESATANAIYDLLFRAIDPTTNSSSGSAQAKRNYAKCEDAAGWICNGRFRQLAGEPIACDDKGRARKYYQPAKVPLQIFLPRVTISVWELVARKAGLPMPEFPVVGLGGETIGFWDWVKTTNCQVILTEGEKKAASLISRGYVAIGLVGIRTGYRVTEKGEWITKQDGTQYQKAIARELHESLKDFNTPGRAVTFLFDYRPGDYFKSPEFQAACTTAKLFDKAIAKIAILPGPDKGVDDFVVAGGDIDCVLSSAESLKQTQNERLWRSYRGFSPDRAINSRYFDTQAPESGKITAIKSGLGTGKTEYLKNKVAVDKTGTQINLTYRNSLGLQLAEKLDSYHLDAHDGYQMFRNPNARLTLCVDSLLKIPEERLEGCTLIIDESASVIKHLLTSRTLFDNRLEVLERFELACQKCDRIILTDGHQADWVVGYISRLSGKAATKIENLFKGDTPPLFFPTPEVGEPLGKFNEWYSQQIVNSPCPALATDSIARAETMARLLEPLHGDGILLTAKTVTEPWAKEFLADPDTYIRSNKPAWLIYSPTAESGVDISIQHYFSDVFCWFFGVIGVDECLQMSRRVRHPERITVVCAERGFTSSKDGDATYYKQIGKAIADRVSAEAAVLTDEALTLATKEAIAEQAQSPHHETYCKIKAKENLERRDLRGYLFKAFEAGGYAPQWVEAGALDQSEHSEAKQECHDIEARQIFDAEDISLAEAFEIERSYSAKWLDRCKAIKARLKARLPGIENSELWTWEFVRRVRFEERSLLGQLESAWLFANQDDAEYLQRRKWKNQLRTFLPDLSDRWLKLRLLKGLGLEKILDPDRVWTADSPEVLEVLKHCKKKAIANILGHPGKTSPMRYINRLLALIGVKLVARRVRSGSERPWVYSLNEKSLPENWSLLAELTALKMSLKISDLKMSEQLYQQGVEVVLDEAKKNTNTAPSRTEQKTPPTTEEAWGWVKSWGKWVRCRGVGWCEYGTRYRLLIEKVAEQWGEILAFPDQVRWEAPT